MEALLVRRVLLLLLLVPLALIPQSRRLPPIKVERKLALVIGNAKYNPGALHNPVNDANALAETLRTLGFDVTKRLDLTLPQFKDAVDTFAAKLQRGDLALFYFAGHGMQVNRENYLLPVNFAAQRESDVEFEAYAASRVQAALEGSGAHLRFLILDACRDNLYRFTRSAGGLSPMGRTAVGTLVAFATGENNTASDNRSGANGLYTKHLLEALRTPGLAHDELFKRVREEVYEASGGKQNPAVYDNVFGQFFFRGGVPVERPKFDAAASAYELVKDSNDPANLERFVGAFPDSDQARVARLNVEMLRRVPPAPTRAGTKVHPKDGATYVWIRPGEFLMGCSEGDADCELDEQKPPKRTVIGRGFYVKETEVTQEEYERVTRKNPSHFKGAKRPVEQVGWIEADGYCRDLGLRLPTAAEWEYTARAGTKGVRYGELGTIAWFAGNSRKRTHNVKEEKEPNGWGLYDMLGNVGEWTSTDYDANAKEVRGGNFLSFGPIVRASNRGRGEPTGRLYGIGFRCAGDIP
jgi:formylglycine-generating enzyme required for sulfatase activity/uncharacterized caspase-like protein